MKEEGRTVNSKRNILYGLLQVIASQVLPFVVRTVLIYRFGVDYLGLNSLFASVLTILSLMELGFGTAVVYSMYKPVAQNNTEQICAYLGYYKRIYRVIGFVVLVFGLVLMPFLKLLIKDPTLPGNLNLYLCYSIFLGDSVISYLLFGYLTSIPTAYQRNDILSRIDICMSFTKCAVQIIVLLCFHNFYLYLVTIPLITVARNLVIARSVNHLYPEIKCRGEISSDQKRELIRKVSGIFVNKLTIASRSSIDSICISTFIGLSITGIYNSYFFIIAGVSAFSTMVCSSNVSSVGNSIAVESRDKNYKDLRLFDFIYMAIAAWATVCLLCLYQPFIRTWLGESMMLDTSVVIGLSLYFFILKSGDIRWVYHEGAGLWYEARFIMIGEAIANIVLNILLCKFLGVFGIVLATVISVFVTNMILCPKLIFKLYFQNGKLKEYWLDHVFYTITMLISAGLSWLICEWLLPIKDAGMMEGIFCLLGRLLICTSLSIAVFWQIWHRSERYYIAVDWLKRLRKA